MTKKQHPILTIENLFVTCEHEGEEISILQGVNLTVLPGEVHAIMGPNGAGKSTLAKVLAGHPAYTITSGSIHFQGEDISELEPNERAVLGLFLGFQYPVEIPGVSNVDFLHAARSALCKAKGLPKPSLVEFKEELQAIAQKMRVPEEFLERGVNEGFSGGEKKRNEILQMAVLDPLCAILDETDSGLDIDAMRIVAEGICHLMTEEKGLLLITHYERLLEYVQPHHVHVMMSGRIVRSGDMKLARTLEEKGYDWLEEDALEVSL